MRKISLIVLLFVVSMLFAGCTAQNQATSLEQAQQGPGVLAIVQNQPVPDLGGWSFEREIVKQTLLARNNTIATYTYMMTLDGKIIEICASIGYPIPYSTKLTNPQMYAGNSAVLAQSEPNSLYAPDNAAATWVQCTNEDKTVTPTYFEQDVFALPYRIVSDVQLVKVGNGSSFSVKTTK